MASPLTRRSLLAGAGAGAVLGSAALASARGRPPRRLVVVFANGGWDVSFVMDPKLHTDLTEGPERDEDPDEPADREALRTFGALPIAVNDHKRPAVTAFFERFAARTAIVNGVWMGSIAHRGARARVLTGRNTEAAAAWATIVGARWGADRPLGSIDLSIGTYAGKLAASMGQVGKSGQIRELLQEGASFPAPAGAPYTLPQFRPDASDRAELTAYLQARTTAFAQGRAGRARNAELLEARQEALRRAARLRRDGADILGTLKLGTSPSLPKQVGVAVDLLEADLCRAITLGPHLQWDTHDDNSHQHGFFETLFREVGHLVFDLERRGLLDDTLVVVTSEFTRTPRYNSTGGKDHWPHASCLMIGANVVGNRVYGATDDRIESLPVDFATGEPDPRGRLNKYDNLAAGILAAFDVDPEEWLPGAQPFTACFG